MNKERINIASHIITISIISFFISTYIFSISSEISTQHRLKGINFTTKEFTINSYPKLLVDAEIRITTEQLDEFKSTFVRLPINILEKFPEYIYILSENNYIRNIGKDTAGATLAGGEIIINYEIFTKSEISPTYYFDYLQDVIYHEFGHSFMRSNSDDYLAKLAYWIIPQTNSLKWGSDFLIVSHWDGPKYFNSIYPLTPKQTIKQSDYGKTDIHEDFAESVRFVLSGRSYLLNHDKASFVETLLNIDSNDMMKYVFPLPKFNPDRQKELNSITSYDYNFKKSYNAVYQFFISEKEFDEYIENLGEKTKQRGFFVTNDNQDYMQIEYLSTVYIVPKKPEIIESDGRRVLNIFISSDRNKLLPTPFRNEN